jgi:uncharacterized protein (DUF983 family)
MSAATSAFTQPAMGAGQDCAKRMPFSMCAMCMAALLMIGTGVLASVSLFVPTFVVATPLFVSLVVVLSLILISLTGLRGLVGLTVRLDLSASQGD